MPGTILYGNILELGTGLSRTVLSGTFCRNMDLLKSYKKAINLFFIGYHSCFFY